MFDSTGLITVYGKRCRPDTMNLGMVPKDRRGRHSNRKGDMDAAVAIMVRQFYTQDLVLIILKYQVNSKKESIIVASAVPPYLSDSRNWLKYM